MSTKIKSFLEFAVYYKRFRQGFSSIVAPLTRITRKEGHFVWTNKYKYKVGSMCPSSINCHKSKSQNVRKIFILVF